MDYDLAGRALAENMFVQNNACATLDTNQLKVLAQTLDEQTPVPQELADALTSEQLFQAANVIDLIKNPPPPEKTVEKKTLADLLVEKGLLTKEDLSTVGLAAAAVAEVR